MNPGYAGRSELPENLKQLFRSFAMAIPDKELIAQVLLFAQGFGRAEFLASKIVPHFECLAAQLSKQRHYDFGLRALKSVLNSAGIIHRSNSASSQPSDRTQESETKILIQSIKSTVFPKLVAEDIELAETYFD
jgi:dynein heavy chain 1